MTKSMAELAPDLAHKKAFVLINRSFAILWIGQAISTIGDFVFNTTLILWIVTSLAVKQSWGPLAVSGVLLATSIPTVFVGPLAGVFVDRWDKRRTMLWADALRAVLIGLLFLMTLLRNTAYPTALLLTVIYSVVFLTTACSQFFGPARMALIGDLVEEDLRPRATGLLQITMGLAIVFGPLLATPLYFGLGVQSAFLINALSFVLSFFAIARLAPSVFGAMTKSKQRPVLADFALGLRFFTSNRVLTTLFVTIFVVMLGAGAIQALDIFFVTQNLHTPVIFYGVLNTALGIGALCGALSVAFLARRVGLVRMFCLAIISLGFFALVYARLTQLVPALIVIGLLGVPMGAFNPLIWPLVLQVTPREFVGRVSAILAPLVFLAMSLSVALAGYLDSTVLRSFHLVLLGITFGPIDTIYTVTGLLVIAGGFYALVTLTKLPQPAAPVVAAEDG